MSGSGHSVDDENRDNSGKFASDGGGGKVGPSDAEKIRNAETMHGTGSRQHQEAVRRFGDSKTAALAGAKDKGTGSDHHRDASNKELSRLAPAHQIRTGMWSLGLLPKGRELSSLSKMRAASAQSKQPPQVAESGRVRRLATA